jgi:hypothetical protein
MPVRGVRADPARCSGEHAQSSRYASNQLPITAVTCGVSFVTVDAARASAARGKKSRPDSAVWCACFSRVLEGLAAGVHA